MKTKYQLSFNGIYSDYLWEKGWHVSLLWKFGPIFIFKWTSPPEEKDKRLPGIYENEIICGVKQLIDLL